MPNQLSLIEVKRDWRISDETRELGLRGVARAREALAAAHQPQSDLWQRSTHGTHSHRHPSAA